MSKIKIAVTVLLSVLGLSIFLMTGCSAQNGDSEPINSPADPAASVPTTGPKSSITTSGSQTSKPAATNSTSGSVVKLKTISFVDQQGIGTEAFKMLIPVDWQYEGGIKWVMDNPAQPAISLFRVWNPKGTEEFSLFPNQAFFWTDSAMTLQLNPVGSKYFGNEVREVMSPLAALKNVVIPRFRAGVQGMKVIKEEEITPSGIASQSGVETKTKAGKIRIEYTENGKVYEDEIICTVDATYYPLQSMTGRYTNIMWGVNYIGSFRAEKGKLDSSAKLFETMKNSVTLNINWFNTYVQVIEYLIKMQIQQIKSIGELGSIVANTSSQIRQENLDLYNQREAANDKISTQFSEYIRGVDSYYNPLEEKNVEMPTGYSNVWVNGNGEYVLSDNTSYNPNVGSTQNFQRLEKAQN